MTSIRPSRAVTLAWLAFVVGAPAVLGGGPAIDFSVGRIEVNQAVQDNFTTLVAGRTTIVRAVVKQTGATSGGSQVDGILRVFAGGAEIAGSPFFSSNGPITTKPTIDLGAENDTLNFAFLAPAGNDVVVQVEVNPPGPSFVPESDLANNVKANPPALFRCQRVMELAYVPIDYRPSGGSVPNLPDPLLMEPGMGDNFVQAIYPTPDWNYHRSDAPSKLWTSSLSGGGSTLLNSLEIDWQMMNPRPDLLYAFVPGGLPYNGQAKINGPVAMGNSEPIRYQRTMAHEIGHNFGLSHNGLTVGYYGVDVEDHLALPLGLPTIKPSSLKDIMYGGLLTSQAWVTVANYSFFANHAWLTCAPAKAGAAAGQPDGADSTLMVTGLLDRRSGAPAWTHGVTFEGGVISESLDAAGEVRVRGFANGVLAFEAYVAASTSLDDCTACRGDHDSSTHADPLAAFSAVMPEFAPSLEPIDRVEALVLASGIGAEWVRSANAPQVVIAPLAAGDEGEPVLSWTATDADGDRLTSYVRYLPGAGRVVPLATGIEAHSLPIDLSALPRAEGTPRLEVLVSDGLRTSRSVVDLPATPPGAAPKSATGAPWIHVVSPNDGTTHPQGATIVLHAAGFDLEDRMLDGPDLVWSSSQDGIVGHGRLTSVADLAPGVHVLTLTGTDSSSRTSSDGVTITIAPRGLPDVGSSICQPNLGFGGPGTSQLSLCGGALGSGASAALELVGARPLSPGLLLTSPSNQPTPAFGGTLVPLPLSFALPLTTNAAGSFAMPTVPGGGGPQSLYLQAIHLDPGLPTGHGISNAIRADFLP
jgi:hypothetical protein